MPRYVVGSPTGLLVKGTIDIAMRANVAVVNPDGSISSVRSATYTFASSERTGRVHIPPTVRAKHKGLAILVPTVIPKNGKWYVDNSQYGPLNRALATGLHLGVFDTEKHANRYGNALHLEQAAAGRRRMRSG